jgi:hypothetical protein
MDAEIRPSMLSLVQRANYLLSVKCANPQCQETNLRGRKPMIELTEAGEAYCNTCGTSWHPVLVPRVAVG